MKLYKHQEKILELLTECDRFMVLAEQGTGKTFPMLLHITNLLISGEAKKWLVIAPLSALGAWERDLSRLSPLRQKVAKDAITFINYDKVSRKGSKWQQTLSDTPWDGITLDEGHAISNPTSNRTRFLIGTPKFMGIAERATYRYIMTGTLITNGRLEDVWSPMRFLLGDEWHDKAYFWSHFLKTVQLPSSFVRIVTGYKNTDELLESVSRYSIRVEKKDCLDLPAKMEDEVVTIPLEAKKEYEEMLKEGTVDAFDIIADNPLVHSLRLRQISSGYVGNSDTGEVHELKSKKITYLKELVESTLPHKVVIFYEFTHSCEQITAMLDKMKVKYVVLNGAQKDKQIWRKFQEDDSIQVFVGQYQSACEGIDLFSSTHTIYFEPTRSSRILEQSRDRTHRTGVQSACNYTFLLTQGTIEEEIYGKLAEYKDFTDDCYKEMMERRNGKVFDSE